MHALHLPPVSYSQLDSLQISFVPALALISSLRGLIQSAKWKERCVLHLLYWFVRSTEAEGGRGKGGGGSVWLEEGDEES